MITAPRSFRFSTAREFVAHRAAAGVEKIQALLRGLEERPALELEIQGNFEPVADEEGLRREKLEQQLRQDKWAALRKSEQGRTPPNQIVLKTDDRRYSLTRVYNAMIKTNETAMTARPATKSVTPGPGVGALYEPNFVASFLTSL